NAGGRRWPAARTPYLNSSFLTPQSGLVYQDKNATAERISSARLHKIKELKNEIFDMQRKIEASSFENQALKELTRRHAKAIGRYNNAESHLQGLLARHCEEMKGLRQLLKVSQEAEKNTARQLRKVEAELRRAKGDFETLAVLSEDKALAERDELNYRLAVLNGKLEAKDERIQSLEMQLKLNSSTFSRQLASESRKLLEAGITTKNLIMEINSVHQKIKEKDRQLFIKNIYANRMPKILKDTGLRVDRSVQVDKESFRALLLSQHQETEKSLIQLKKEKKSSEEKAEEAKADEVCSDDAQCRTEKQPTKKIPASETCNRTQRETRLQMEEHTFSEFMEEMEKETEFLKQELKNLMKTEQNPQSDGVKENNREGHTEEEAEKGEKKPGEQQKKKAKSEGAIPSKEPIRLKKKYIFSEATENLHQGLSTSGPKSKAGSLCSLGQAGQGCRDTFSSEDISFGIYEPSFGQVPPPRQRDGASGAQGCSHVPFGERKKHLMKELFGEGCLQGESPSSSSVRGMK
ncbi:LCA5L protein, partial [Ptilonorhynchus violaceus]|nr:LCA5L protein [Ptilonorhynchus violaceus]